MENKNYKLSDDSIAMVAKLLQVAILTGTDIVDNLRTVEFTVNDDRLSVTSEFAERFEKNVSEMLSFAEENNADD